MSDLMTHLAPQGTFRTPDQGGGGKTELTKAMIAVAWGHLPDGMAKEVVGAHRAQFDRAKLAVHRMLYVDLLRVRKEKRWQKLPPSRVGRIVIMSWRDFHHNQRPPQKDLMRELRIGDGTWHAGPKMAYRYCLGRLNAEDAEGARMVRKQVG